MHLIFAQYYVPTTSDIRNRSVPCLHIPSIISIRKNIPSPRRNIFRADVATNTWEIIIPILKRKKRSPLQQSELNGRTIKRGPPVYESTALKTATSLSPHFARVNSTPLTLLFSSTSLRLLRVSTSRGAVCFVLKLIPLRRLIAYARVTFAPPCVHAQQGFTRVL